MKKNTQLRIISGMVLASMIVAALIFGKLTTTLLLMVFGAISLDEVQTNFLGNTRSSTSYFISMFVFIVGFSKIGPVNLGEGSTVFVYLCAVQSLLFMAYLFLCDIANHKYIELVKARKEVAALFILLPFLATVHFLTFEKWQLVFGLLALVNFGMDTCAWFFGKNFGKRKLWPAVSPNKTVEGLVGGAISAGLLGYLFFNQFIGQAGYSQIVFFVLMAIFSQIGDLFQSKVKRQIGIKDSSSLIPGHGGVYDRIDSIVFMAPFMAIFLNLFYL